MKNYDEKVMSIIGYSGECKQSVYAALKLARDKKFDEADNFLVEAEKELKTANKAAFELLSEEANDWQFKTTLLMVHAFDHLGNAEGSLENARQLIETLKVLMK